MYADVTQFRGAPLPFNQERLAMYDNRLRLEYLMDATIKDRDGDGREDVIREFMCRLDQGANPDDDEQLLNELGTNEAERYKSADELYEKLAQQRGATPKQP
jgi:hypothetical protein